MGSVLVYGTINSVGFALIAIGFSLVYGVSRIPNFAHGSIYVLTGFLTWSLVNDFGLNYALSIVISLALAALTGSGIYWLVLIRLKGLPASGIISSFAVGLIILEGLRLQGIGGFKGFIGPNYILKPFFDGKVEVFGVFVDYQRLIVVGVGLVLAVALWVFTRFSRMGLSLRAVAQDEQAAMMLGINPDRAAVAAMALGSTLAGLAAVVLLPLGNITCEAGYNVLIFALAVCIIGGLGSWAGTVMAAFLMGFAMKVSTYFWGAVWESVILAGTIILVLLVKPSGLLGKQKELEERV